MRSPRLTGALLLLAGIVGCSVGPNYRRPDVQVPATWSAGLDDGVTTQRPVVENIQRP
jgi:hypothetical protein